VSGGFREVGEEGARLEARLVEVARRYGMRLMGPNGIGVIDTITRLNTTFVAGMPQRGAIAFLSQSGAICGGLIDWSRRRGVGFSRFVSIGNEADLTETDLLAFLADDPHTRVIAAYLEEIRDGRRFLEVAREVTRRKPVIVLKVGATPGGARAAASHTGALAGSERAYQAAFRQAGVLRAGSIEELFDQALAFAYQPVPLGNRFAVVTNAGGPGTVAIEAGERAGLRLASLSPDTVRRLEPRFPPAARLENPVDLLGSASPEDYAEALDAVLADPNVDAIIVVHVPQALVDPQAVAEAIAQQVSPGSEVLSLKSRAGEKLAQPATPDQGSTKGLHKPILACFMGEVSVQAAFETLHGHQIPPYAFPERPAWALGAMAAYRCWLETPAVAPELVEGVDRSRACQVIANARAAARRSLGHLESYDLLEAYGIPTLRPQLARTPHEAVELAERMGYPVVVKVAAPQVLHKTDVGGVVLGLQDAESVAAAFERMLNRVRTVVPEAERWGAYVQKMAPPGHEVIVGASRDPRFGPLVMFGLGGVFVEALEDVSFRLAPLTRAEARAMMAETRGERLLRGVRGRPPADRDAIAEVLVRVSQLVTDFPDITELDINPLIAWEEGHGTVAVDVRVLLT